MATCSNRREASRNPSQSVFINCDFSSENAQIFEPLIFTIHACGFQARSLLATSHSSLRMDELLGLVADCDVGIHDISRIDTKGQFARFNVPLGLGLFLAAQRYGIGRNKRKKCLIMVNEPFEYQRFISDLAGHDPGIHGNTSDGVIAIVRQFLANNAPAKAVVPTQKHIFERYIEFSQLFSSTAKLLENLTFREFRRAVTDYFDQKTPGDEGLSRRFQTAVKAFHVRRGEGCWEVQRIGCSSRTFKERHAAVETARTDAAFNKVAVLLHESRHVSEL
jgi:hypothetical protein